MPIHIYADTIIIGIRTSIFLYATFSIVVGISAFYYYDVKGTSLGYYREVKMALVEYSDTVARAQRKIQ